MHIPIPQNLNELDAIRRCGFGLINGQSGPSFVRRLGSYSYPRFHVYINDHKINLHLDQKQASYEGYHAHSGEYDGEVVEKEAQRLREILEKMTSEASAPTNIESAGDPFSNKRAKGFWAKLFGNK